MEAVRVVLSGFELKRSRGDPIQAPGRFAICSQFREISTLNPKSSFWAVLRVGYTHLKSCISNASIYKLGGIGGKTPTRNANL